jgi:hypothetical protein
MGKDESRERQIAEQLPADEHDVRELAEKEQGGTVDDKQDMNGRARMNFPAKAPNSAGG